MLMQVNVKHQRFSDPENAEEATSGNNNNANNDNNNGNNNNNNGADNNDDNDNNNDNSNAHNDNGNNNNEASNNEGASTNDANEEQSSNSKNGDETGKVKVKKGTTLYRILKRAQENAEKSGQPFEYLLDVDYLHDANNPLDNNMKEPTHYVKPDPPTRPSRPSEPKPTPGDHPVDRKRPSLPSQEYVHPECVTRFEPRATTTVLTSLARPGTSCVFGADERDEGSHCIMDISYGSYGWCYTNKARTEWGSCSEKCPLSGQAALLERRINAMDGLVAKLVTKIKKRTKDCDKDKKKKKSSLLTENRKSSGDSSKSSAVSETKLAALRRDGLISEEEFQDLRMELTNLKQD
jgi:hypothetical protein